MYIYIQHCVGTVSVRANGHDISETCAPKRVPRLLNILCVGRRPSLPPSIPPFPSSLPLSLPRTNAHGVQVMGESSVSPYGVAAGECVDHPCAGTVERWCRAVVSTAPAKKTAVDKGTPAAAEGDAKKTAPLGGRVYRLTKLVEKPTAEFARENLVTPGLGAGDDGEGRHLVVFGQYVLPVRRTFDILAEDIELDRRER